MVHHAPQYLLALCMYNTDRSYRAPEHTRSYCRFRRCCRCCRRHHRRRHHHRHCHHLRRRRCRCHHRRRCHRLRRRRRPSRRHSHPGSPRTAMGLKSTGCPRGACEVRHAEVQTAVQTEVHRRRGVRQATHSPGCCHSGIRDINVEPHRRPQLEQLSACGWQLRTVWVGWCVCVRCGGGVGGVGGGCGGEGHCG